MSTSHIDDTSLLQKLRNSVEDHRLLTQGFIDKFATNPLRGSDNEDLVSASHKLVLSARQLRYDAQDLPGSTFSGQSAESVSRGIPYSAYHVSTRLRDHTDYRMGVSIPFGLPYPEVGSDSNRITVGPVRTLMAPFERVQDAPDDLPYQSLGSWYAMLKIEAVTTRLPTGFDGPAA